MVHQCMVYQTGLNYYIVCLKMSRFRLLGVSLFKEKTLNCHFAVHTYLYTYVYIYTAFLSSTHDAQCKYHASLNKFCIIMIYITQET